MKIIDADNAPYKAAGMVQFAAQTYCSSAVTDQDHYLMLKKYDVNRAAWINAATRWVPNLVSGKFHNLHWYYDCATTSVRRNWRAQVDAYAEMKGTWYGGTVRADHSRYCNT